MRHAYTLTAVVLILLWAIVLQLPLIHNMAAQLLRQGSPIIHSIRGLLPHHKVISVPPTLLASSTLNSPLNPHQPSSQTSESAHPPDHKHFSTSSTTMASTKPFLAAVESRRTIYPLKNESPISDERIKEIVTMAIKHAPSAFNSQTGRVVVVLKKEHVKLWEAIMQVYKAMLPEDKYNGAKERFDMFKGAYGTVSPISILIPVQRSRLTALCNRYSSTKTPPTCVNFKRSSRPTKTSSHNVSALPTQNLTSVLFPANKSSLFQGPSRAMA